MKIININGPINAGKTTISKLLADKLPQTLFIEVDDLLSDAEQEALALSLQEGWQERIKRLDVIVRNEMMSQRYKNIIFAFPITEKTYKEWKNWEDGKNCFVNITLSPPIEICLQNRDGRELSDFERKRIVKMYQDGYHRPPFSDFIIDNGRQKPEETLQKILAFLKEKHDSDL